MSIFKIKNYITISNDTYNMYRVAAIITTYNRYDFLITAIKSIKNQQNTLEKCLIIIVNDASTDPRYYDSSLEENFKECIVLNLEQNSKSIVGFSCPGGYQRNIGMSFVKNNSEFPSINYFAFLDDDDYWCPNKLAMQLREMQLHNLKISSTDAYTGKGANVRYLKHIPIQSIPKKINRKHIERTNYIICSSVMIHKSVFDEFGGFIALGDSDDYEYWLRILEKYECSFIPEPLVYYNSEHAGKISYIKNNWVDLFQKTTRDQKIINSPFYQELIKKPYEIQKFIKQYPTYFSPFLYKLL